MDVWWVVCPCALSRHLEASWVFQWPHWLRQRAAGSFDVQVLSVCNKFSRHKHQQASLLLHCYNCIITKVIFRTDYAEATKLYLNLNLTFLTLLRNKCIIIPLRRHAGTLLPPIKNQQGWIFSRQSGSDVISLCTPLLQNASGVLFV